MTCIVAFRRGNTVWMGGDSASVGGLGLVQRADSKVFRTGDFLFGFTSSWRMGQVLRYSFKPPPRAVDQDLLEYMATSFIDDARKVMKDKGFARIKDHVDEGGVFLVATEGRIFKIDSDFHVGESIHPFDACGCGEDIAFGALFVAQHGKIPGREVVTLALEAAVAFSAGVRDPYFIIDSDEQDEE